MSLRRDVRLAFDQIAPPTAGMPERVVQTVLAEYKARRRKERMLLRLRAPLSLVAVFLVIAVIAAVLVGSRVVQDWHAFHRTTPAGKADTSAVSELESRPLHLPAYQSRSECNTGPFNADNSALGTGPLYIYGGSASKGTNWGSYYKRVLYTDEQISGPILVRARDLVNGIPVYFVGNFASGPAVGTDLLQGAKVEQHPQMVLSERTTSQVIDNPPAKPHAFVWEFTAGQSKNSSGANGWQIDGLGFSEVFLVC